jgi:hypothetical protein
LGWAFKKILTTESAAIYVADDLIRQAQIAYDAQVSAKKCWLTLIIETRTTEKIVLVTSFADPYEACKMHML